MTADDFVFGESVSTATLNLPPVTAETLLKIPAAYDAINVIVRPIKTLPLVFFDKVTEPDGHGRPRMVKRRLDSHQAKDMLAAPNDWQDRVEFLEFVGRSLVTHNNAFAEIVMTAGHAQLWPLDFYAVDVQWRHGQTSYIVHNTDGTTRTIPAARMWHMKVGPFDAKGIAGIGPLKTNQEVLQSALAVIEYGGRFFGNDASPTGGYWKTPNGLSETARKNVKQSLAGFLGGRNRHKTTVSEEGLEYVPVGADNDKAQFIDTKKMDTVEIARIWSLPPHKLKSLDAATFSNIEQQAIEFVVYSLAPWLTAIETSIKTHLIGLDNPTFCEFNVLGLLRGDIKARYDAYAIGRNWGWLSADDVLRLENMNPLPDGTGNKYLTPLNMADVADDIETD